jgi:hypothetical protein
MRSHIERKQLHLKLDPTTTRYWVYAEYALERAATMEEEERVRQAAQQQIEAALRSYSQQGWVLDGTFEEAVTLHRHLVAHRGGWSSHDHFAAIVEAYVRVKRDRGS